MKFKMKSNPNRIFDRTPLYDDEWIYDPEECKNCKKPIAEHNSTEAIECALSITKGGLR